MQVGQRRSLASPAPPRLPCPARPPPPFLVVRQSPVRPPFPPCAGPSFPLPRRRRLACLPVVAAAVPVLCLLLPFYVVWGSFSVAALRWGGGGVGVGLGPAS
eukprot:164353-Chlamydomonas_euryale.AAC.1